VLHSSTSMNISLSQGLPPRFGGIHSLLLNLVPPSQLALQALHSLHSVKRPSTKRRNRHALAIYTGSAISYQGISYDCRFDSQYFHLHTIYHYTEEVYNFLTESEHHHHKLVNTLTNHSNLTILHQLV